MEKLKAGGVVPDVVDEAPEAKITVSYPGNIEADYGNELTPTQVKDEPKLKWDADPAKYYTLSMVDPDVPTREAPQYAQINHWLVINIKGDDVSSGEKITGYGGSKPRKGHGLHRYIFLVFEQNGKLELEKELKEQLSSNRRNFSIRDFSKTYNVGKLIAANYYEAQWDPYVDIAIGALANK